MDKGLFKMSVVGGFRRGDVLSYINEVDSKHLESENELKENIAKLKSQLEAAGKEKKQGEEKLKAMEETLRQANDSIASLLEEKQKLEGELSAGMQARQQKEAETDRLNHDLLIFRQHQERLESECAQKDREIERLRQENGSLAQKIADFSKTEDQIAKVMLEARKSADQMLDEAKRESDTVLQDSVGRVQRLAEGLPEFYAEVSAIREKAKNFYDASDGMLDRLYSSAVELERQFLNGEGLKEGQKAAEAGAAASEDADGDGQEPSSVPNFDFSSGAASECACEDNQEM